MMKDVILASYLSLIWSIAHKRYTDLSTACLSPHYRWEWNGRASCTGSLLIFMISAQKCLMNTEENWIAFIIFIRITVSRFWFIINNLTIEEKGSRGTLPPSDLLLQKDPLLSPRLLQKDPRSVSPALLLQKVPRLAPAGSSASRSDSSSGTTEPAIMDFFSCGLWSQNSDLLRWLGLEAGTRASAWWAEAAMETVTRSSTSVATITLAAPTLTPLFIPGTGMPTIALVLQCEVKIPFGKTTSFLDAIASLQVKHTIHTVHMYHIANLLSCQSLLTISSQGSHALRQSSCQGCQAVMAVMLSWQSNSQGSQAVNEVKILRQSSCQGSQALKAVKLSSQRLSCHSSQTVKHHLYLFYQH